MKPLLLAAAVATAGVVLAGCGDSSRPSVEPDLAGKPTWAGCHSRSIGIIDYVSDAGGTPTAGAALAPYRTAGDHVVVVPARAHQNRRWLLVDDANLIHASLELEHGGHGWLVGSVEKCAP
jgi:hypothetical protein